MLLLAAEAKIGGKKREEAKWISKHVVAPVEAAAGDRGRDGHPDRLQGPARRLLLHGGQVRRDAVPGLRARARGLQARLRRHEQEAPVLRPRRRHAHRRVVEDVRQGLLRQGRLRLRQRDVREDIPADLLHVRLRRAVRGVPGRAALPQVAAEGGPRRRHRQQRRAPVQGRRPAGAGAQPGVGVGLRGVLGRRRRGEARPEDLRGGAAAGGRRERGRGARGGAPHRRQPAQGLRPRAEPRDARAPAGPVPDRRGGELAEVRRARAPGPRRRAGVARRGSQSQGGSGPVCHGQVTRHARVLSS